MASEIQYQIYKDIYDQEQHRQEELINRGKIYHIICAFFLGGSAFKLQASQVTGFMGWIYLAGVLAFVLSFLLILLSLGIYQQERLFHPIKLIQSMGDKPPTDEDFLDDRIVDIAVAHSRNLRVNYQRAKLLRVASVLMVVGVVCVLTSLYLTSDF